MKVRTILKVLMFVGLAALLAIILLWIYYVGRNLTTFETRMNPLGSEWVTPPQWAVDGSQVVFSHEGRIYLVESDGSALKLIHGSKDEPRYSAAISPDGSQIAYLKYFHKGFLGWFESEGWGVYVSALDGTMERTVYEPPAHLPVGVSSPSWSPDGKRVAFLSLGNVYTVATDGSDRRTVVDWRDENNPADFRGAYDRDTPVEWSPNGQRIAFVGYGDNDRDIPKAAYTIGVDGSGLKRIAVDGSGAWSPDGAQMAIVLSELSNKDFYAECLYVVSHDDPSPPEWRMRLPQGEIERVHWDRTVEWSPDGSTVLVGPYVASADGSALRVLPRPDFRGEHSGEGWKRITSVDGYSLTAWSPDGSMVAVQMVFNLNFISGYESVLYLVAQDGSVTSVLVMRDEVGNLLPAGGKPLSQGQSMRVVNIAGQC